MAQAIVNMDDLHFKGKKEPFSGSVSLAASSVSGNTDQSSVNLSTQVQWNREEYINLIVLGYAYGKSNGERNVKNSFIHTRHVHQLSESLDYELYAQLEENEFTRLNYRGLYGAGLRIPFWGSKSHIAFLGLGGFHEVEKISDSGGGSSDGEIHQTERWNFYLMSRYKGDTVKFSNTLYWQPRMGDFPDRRGLFVSLLKVKANKDLYMTLKFEVAHDSLPPAGVEETDKRVKTGFEYEF
ncbi:MAG: DUF481 domain-containing protein [Gammaproteobacteria bacterium]|nr:DUF481 domain-containing protein [Gammaproteobacteria bacterium]MDH5778743.1 DUF481 domain-containing protein [Gammaproteobacteria bacterium]